MLAHTTTDPYNVFDTFPGKCYTTASSTASESCPTYKIARSLCYVDALFFLPVCQSKSLILWFLHQWKRHSSQGCSVCFTKDPACTRPLTSKPVDSRKGQKPKAIPQYCKPVPPRPATLTAENPSAAGPGRPNNSPPSFKKFQRTNPSPPAYKQPQRSPGPPTDAQAQRSRAPTPVNQQPPQNLAPPVYAQAQRGPSPPSFSVQEQGEKARRAETMTSRPICGNGPGCDDCGKLLCCCCICV